MARKAGRFATRSAQLVMIRDPSARKAAVTRPTGDGIALPSNALVVDSSIVVDPPPYPRKGPARRSPGRRPTVSSYLGSRTVWARPIDRPTRLTVG